MKSPSSLVRSIIVSAVLILGVFGLTSGHSLPNQCSSSGPKVKVDVYYETMCPDSISFLTQHLIPTYHTLGCVLDLTLYPFGKATIEKYGDKYSYECQHGPKECHGNLIQACALRETGQNYTRSLPFIDCMEKEIYSRFRPDIDAIGSKCAKLNGYEYKTLKACATSDTGYKMMKMIGDKTKSVTPRISFIPTVAINGRPSAKARNYFTREVCLAHKSSDGPEKKVTQAKNNSIPANSTGVYIITSATGVETTSELSGEIADITDDTGINSIIDTTTTTTVHDLDNSTDLNEDSLKDLNEDSVENFH